MPIYRCEKPTYKLFPYEAGLGAAEIAALTGGSVEPCNGDFVVRTRSPIPLDRFARLAFTSRVHQNGNSFETEIARLEASSLRVKYGTADTARKESNYLTHGLHRYKGKFYPQLSRALVNLAGLEAGGLVFDPFMGSGTTLVEAWLIGVDSIGFDLSPLAQRIAYTKIHLLESKAKALEPPLTRFERSLKRSSSELGIVWTGFGSPEPEADPDFPSTRLAIACGVPGASGEFERWFPGPVRHEGYSTG
jgi:site-specific DNA-methyltransferase (cytosine-N4-specific)